MVIDSHCHIFPPSFQRRHAELSARDATFDTLFPSSRSRMATADTLIDAMDGAGVSRAVAMGMGWTDRLLAQEANDYIIESVGRYPSRLSGFCSVNPAWGDAAVAELDRCAGAGLMGVGELHPDTQGFDIGDGSVLAPVMDEARRLGLPVLVHASEPVGHPYPGKGRTTPERLYPFLERFPDNKIICAHWGGGLPFYSLMPEVAAATSNLYFDTAASPFLYRREVFAAVVSLVGADKVLFGTDFPLLRHQRLLRQVEQAGLDAGARQAILGGNVARLLGL